MLQKLFENFEKVLKISVIAPEKFRFLRKIFTPALCGELELDLVWWVIFVSKSSVYKNSDYVTVKMIFVSAMFFLVAGLLKAKVKQNQIIQIFFNKIFLPFELIFTIKKQSIEIPFPLTLQFTV